MVGLLDTWASCNAGCSSQESGFRGLGLRIRVSVDLSGVNNLERLVHFHYKQSIIINCSLRSRPAGLLARVKLWRYIHLCEFCEKVRQYCINKFVRTILLSKNIILFENNTYIIVKKIGAKNSTRKQWFCKTPYIYYFKKLEEARSVTRAQALCITINLY